MELVVDAVEVGVVTALLPAGVPTDVPDPADVAGLTCAYVNAQYTQQDCAFEDTPDCQVLSCLRFESMICNGDKPPGDCWQSAGEQPPPPDVAMAPECPPPDCTPPEGMDPNQPPDGMDPGQPPEGMDPNQPPEGMDPDQPPEGMDPDQPPEGMDPDQPPEGMDPSQPPEGMDPSQPPDEPPPPGMC